MRRINAILSVGITALFLIHGIAGGFKLLGIIPGGSRLLNVLTWFMAAMLVAHIIIGVILTIKSIKISKKSGVSYRRDNLLFLLRRISGFVLMLFICFHLAIFMQTDTDYFRLSYFGIMEIAGQFIMLLALAIHILCNIKPLTIALGFYDKKGYLLDALLILCVVFVFFAIAFVFYYLRWNVLWR